MLYCIVVFGAALILFKCFSPGVALLSWSLVVCTAAFAASYRYVVSHAGREDDAPASPAVSALLLFAGFFAIYLCCQNIGYLDATDAEERFALIDALRHGEVKVDVRWETAPRNSLYLPGQSLLALPFVMLGERLHRWRVFDQYDLEIVRLRAVLAYCAFISALQIAGLFCLAWRLFEKRPPAYLVAICAGLATMIFPYAKSFQTENAVGCLLVWGLFLLFQWERGQRHPYCLVALGALLAIGLTIRHEIGLWYPSIALYLLLKTWRTERKWLQNLPRLLPRLGLLCLPALLALGLLAWYNHARYGALAGTGYEDYRLSAWLIPHGLLVVFLSPGKSVFLYSPIIICGLLLGRSFFRRFKLEALLMAGIYLALTLLYAAWWSPAGDNAWGPRFQTPYLALWCLPLGLLMEKPPARWLLMAFAALFAVSFCIQLWALAARFIDHYELTLNAFQPSEKYQRISDYLYFNPLASPIWGQLKSLMALNLDFLFLKFDDELRWLRFALTGQALLLSGAALLRLAAAGRVGWEALAAPPRRPKNLALAGALTLAVLAYNVTIYSTGVKVSIYNQRDNLLHSFTTSDQKTTTRQKVDVYLLVRENEYVTVWEGYLDADRATELRAETLGIRTLTLNDQRYKPESLDYPWSMTAPLRAGRNKVRFRTRRMTADVRVNSIHPYAELSWRKDANAPYQDVPHRALAPSRVALPFF